MGLYILLQSALIIALLCTGPLWPQSFYLQIVLVGFKGLMLWTVVVLVSNRMGTYPQIVQNPSLITSGPFKWVRHPMYISVIMVSCVLVTNHFNTLRLLLLLTLIGVMVAKALAEERVLCERLPGYSEYRQNSRMFLPFVL